MDDIRIVDTNCLEMKTVAGFINYKICKLMFKLNAPRDSIGHFKNHIDKFRSRTGFKELIFEHFAWLSMQFSAFAELFCDAIKYGLPPLQTEHPGIYYHKAAEYMSKRKEAFRECFNDTTAITPDSGVFYSDFFGVRNTKIGDSNTENHVIAIVQANEKYFNHSVCLI